MYEITTPTYKVVFVGESNVGKTSILNQMVDWKFDPSENVTIAAGFFTKNVTINGNECILNIWDTAGQEKYRNVVDLYFRDISVVVIVFDVSNHSSYQMISYWIEIVKNKAPENVKIIICGNKIDLVDDREVFIGEMPHPYIETSAKTGIGVSALFDLIIIQIRNLYNIKDGKSRQLNSNDSESGCC